MKLKNTFIFPAILMLSQFEVEDQFSQKVDWKNFESTPQILVFAGKAAAKEAQSWGIFLHDKFNSQLKPSKEHLQATLPTEKIKVVAVATLPEVPGIFKGLFRSGFRKESSSMPLALDFSRRLSGTFGYHDDEKEPLLVFLPSGRFSFPKGGVVPKDLQESEGAEAPAILLRGLASNVETQQKVFELASDLIQRASASALSLTRDQKKASAP
jgi:hypothetical protein